MVLMSAWPMIHRSQQRPKVLILGYYDRYNLGDEAFKAAFTKLLYGYKLTFACIDDFAERRIPDDFAFVIVGGGDVVNPYFMEKISDRLLAFPGNKYAISVGVPFDDGLKFLSVFDHVIVRSSSDVVRVSKVIGQMNVSFLPDITCVLHEHVAKVPLATRRVAVCLARPYFPRDNVPESAMFRKTVALLTELTHRYHVDLLPFNVDPDPKHSDEWLNDMIRREVKSKRLAAIKGVRTPAEMISAIGKYDLVLGMRFHSIQFALNAGIPFVALYTTRKIDILLKDVNCVDFGIALPTDSAFMPKDVDVKRVMETIESRFSLPFSFARNIIEPFQVESIIDGGRKTKSVRYEFQREPWTSVLSRCEVAVSNVVGIRSEDWTESLRGIDSAKMDLVSRCLAFAVTGRIGSSYEWGLVDQLRTNPEFRVLEGLRWIYDDMCSTVKEERYLPRLNRLRKRVTVNLNYMDQDTCRRIHRSGWSYVMGGLMHLQSGDSDLKVDLSVERTFFWGKEVLCNAGMLPYSGPWMGFVHHTFDQEYSDFNCRRLFEDSAFLRSLPFCKGLVCLSEYLAYQLRTCLSDIRAEVPVFVMVHPTEFPSRENMFTMGAFLKNEHRKVVQVGAWLRNTYSIYELRVPRSGLRISKACLKGAEMDNYFAPEWLFSSLVELLDVKRDPGNVSTICRSHKGNKYVEGMVDMLMRYDASVEIIQRLDDDEYDHLLSENVIFLNLVDASAVNSVIECIVRHTPVFVNRHPALEEILGEEYPGFYVDMEDASEKISCKDTVMQCHEYLCSLEKEKLRLDYFVEHFQKIVEILNA